MGRPDRHNLARHNKWELMKKGFNLSIDQTEKINRYAGGKMLHILVILKMESYLTSKRKQAFKMLVSEAFKCHNLYLS